MDEMIYFTPDETIELRESVEVAFHEGGGGEITESMMDRLGFPPDHWARDSEVEKRRRRL